MIKKGWIYGIYYIPQSKFIYIGMTQDSINDRRRHHLHYLKNDKHYNSKLQTLFNKSDQSHFKFVELFEKVCNRKELEDYEKYYISHYHTLNENDEYSCNQTEGGGGNTNKMTEEARLQMIETKKKMYELGLIQTTDGEINGMHVLVESEVLEIINLLKSKKYTHSQIGKMYNVSRSLIGLIANGERWSYLDEVREFAKSNTYTKPTVVPIEDVVKIKYYKEVLKLTNNKIVDLLGYNYELVRKMPKRKKYKDINLEEFGYEIS